MDLQYELEFIPSNPSLINDQALVSIMRNACEKTFERTDNIEEFNRRNEILQQAATNALTYSGRTIPSVVSISYLNYALSAVIGGFMAIYGIMDLGSLSSYLVFVRQTAMPVNSIFPNK